MNVYKIKLAEMVPLGKGLFLPSEKEHETVVHLTASGLVLVLRHSDHDTHVAKGGKGHER